MQVTQIYAIQLQTSGIQLSLKRQTCNQLDNLGAQLLLNKLLFGLAAYYQHNAVLK